MTSIYKDKLGFMWFGTYWGLNRFDGHEVKNYFHDNFSEELTLSHNNILWMSDGPGDMMLIQTGAQLSGFDVYKECFVDVSYILNAIPVQSGQVQKALKDKNGDLWMIGTSYGLFKMTSEKEMVFLNSNEDGVFQNTPLAEDIIFDKNGNLVVGHKGGRVVVLDISTHKILEEWQLKNIDQGDYTLNMYMDTNKGMWTYSRFETEGVQYYANKESEPVRFDKQELGSNLISSVLEDNLGRVVIATDHGGLTLIDKSDMSMSRHSYNPSDPTSLNHYGAIAAYNDDEGTIWVGTNKGGISYFNPSANAFEYYKYSSDENEVFNDINTVVIHGKDKVWVGSDKGGLMRLNLKNNKYEVIDRASGTALNNIKSTTVVSLAKGNNGIWIGTYHGGLSFFDGKKFTNYHDIPGQYDLPGNSAWTLFVDSRENLWVGTLRAGTIVFNKKHEVIYEYNAPRGHIISDYITSFDEDEEGNIWMGTGYGVYVIDKELSLFKQIINNAQNVNSLINNSIEDVYCGSDGSVWMGTQDGLSQYLVKEDSFINYTFRDGLISNYIVSIEEDKNRNIWIGTNKGLSQLKRFGDQYVFYNYNESDGLQGELFNQNSSAQSEDGIMAFAGANGLNMFNPIEIKPPTSTDKIVFSELYIANRKIETDRKYNGRKILTAGLNRTEKIELKPSENSFTFGFTALNFQRPDKVSYRYMLEGFDKNWVLASPQQRNANYTNLDPGAYKFRVQGTSDVNSWGDKEIQMEINIAAPLWKTPLAYFGYFTIGLLILYIILRIRIDRERLKGEIENEKIQARRIHELDLMKIRFFTNIGHEFRTPLTLILTPIERILNSVHDAKFSKEYTVIQKNAKRLLTLVNQLLDFRKMEAGQHQLSLSGGDLVKFLEDIIESFSDLSNENNIQIRFKSEFNEFLTQFDRDKMEKVMFNLFSNAFKFTEPGGAISLNLKALESNNERYRIQISLSDTGIGIAKENLHHVFARFYQSDVPSNMINHGSGIGLAITKEFVEIHKGTISVQSEPNEGTTFFIELPLDKKAVLEELKVENSHETRMVQDQMNTLNSKKYTVILVEDNADFRFYLKDNLGQYFNMLEAENGEVGYEKILQHQPDLIVSDVMMPVMNGIDMTLKLKKERKTKHIPIILLSSHQSDTHKIEGLQAGAMDFISKPFNFEILENRIKSALRLKENITDSQKKIEVSPSEIAITSLDEKLIQKALAIVEENMSNADFSVQELSRELGVSRAQLYKKVVSITGQSPIEFIRDIRLKRAALLLEKSQLSVSEIAYKVGFNNPRYFSNYFKAAYHILPSKYVENMSVKAVLED